MSLKNILLGMLEEPQSGYDIKRQFEHVFKHFWSAELAQIYPTLNKLEQEGLATSTAAASSKGPARRVYRRTQKGSRELRNWLLDGPILGKDRLHYLAQAYFLANVSAGEQERFFRLLRYFFKREWKQLKSIEDQWKASDPAYPHDLTLDAQQFSQFTLRLGLLKMESNISWCEECLDVLRQRTQKAEKLIAK